MHPQTQNLVEIKLEYLSLNNAQLLHIFNCRKLSVLEVNDGEEELAVAWIGLSVRMYCPLHGLLASLIIGAR